MAHFGFEAIDDALKSGKVKDVFQRVTGSYDRMNDVMSMGLHRLWKRRFLNHMRIHPGETILDVASGTGDIIQGLYKRYHGLNITFIASDLTESMLMHGKKRALDLGVCAAPPHEQDIRRYEPDCVYYDVADAEHLPYADESVNVYACAYGFRNMTHLDRALHEAYRVLKPGGRLYILEFSSVENTLLTQLYDLYSFHIIPRMGHYIAQDRDAYQYLVESIRRFPNQSTFKNMIEHAGFQNVYFTNLTHGITAIHTAHKP